MKRLYITDLDGTLLSTEGSISAKTAAILNSLTAEGICFTFATARSVYSAKPITSALDINVPCILMNGVSIYDLRADGYLANQYIPVSASEKVIEAFEREKAEVFLYRFNDEVLTCYYTKVTTRVMKSFAEVRRNRYNKPYVQCADLLDAADGRTIYYTALDEHEKLLPVKNAIDSIDGVDYAFYEDTYTGKWFLEVFSAKASKSNGLRYLRERYGFDEVVAFGDNLNDLPMFSEADIKVAVGNARDEVKAAADYIIGTNDEDGVAEWLLAAHNKT
ncbi:HAD family hydrolase [Ruminococcus flavefaciens]|uniref:HAD family hydrolase n=1 Tax=Ruminococcus flavefaciens TaxID=1265 RepID=UPI0026F15B2A|nr:HAD family hydrolase [Ruminococcus flavefaciens]